jgi:hypothetical protein
VTEAFGFSPPRLRRDLPGKVATEAGALCVGGLLDAARSQRAGYIPPHGHTRAPPNDPAG